MSVHAVDQDARDMARDAQAAIDAHTQECAIQWRNTAGTLKEIKGILAYGGVLLISCLLGLIYFLAERLPQ